MQNKTRVLAMTAAAVSLSVLVVMAQEPGRGGPGGGGRGGGGLGNKSPDLPANLFTSGSTLARTTLRHEWVDIPLGNVKLHTWIEYPPGEDKAAVVIVMHYDAGLDDLQRAVADQLALEGFIAIEPDLLSGMGPKGGNYDSFPFPDDAIRANAKLTASEVLRRYKAARDYGLKLPRANGKSASLGEAVGGANSFRFAGEVPELNAAVVFYGMPPGEATMARIKAPVLGLYGEDDPKVNATIEPTAAAMKRLGKSYESHIYPRATHAFMSYMVEGENGAAVAQAWPAAIAFLKQNTK
jgi:carboxymethylenebutenolidase